MIGGTATDTYSTPMQTPQTWVYVTQFGNEPYTVKNAQLASITGQVLSKRLLDIVREEMGATYSCGAQGSMERIGDQNSEVLTAFPMKPEMKDAVLKVIKEQFEGVAKEVKPMVSTPSTPPLNHSIPSLLTTSRLTWPSSSSRATTA